MPRVSGSLTASFSVTTTSLADAGHGRRAKSSWSPSAHSTMARPFARSRSKKRSGRASPATATTSAIAQGGERGRRRRPAGPPVAERDDAGERASCDEPGQRRRRGGCVVENQLARAEPRRNTLAQRAGGEQPAVAGTALVEDDDLDIALERQVLQAVVAEHDVDFGMSL